MHALEPVSGPLSGGSSVVIHGKHLAAFSQPGTDGHNQTFCYFGEGTWSKGVRARVHSDTNVECFAPPYGIIGTTPESKLVKVGISTNGEPSCFFLLSRRSTAKSFF